MNDPFTFTYHNLAIDKETLVDRAAQLAGYATRLRERLHAKRGYEMPEDSVLLPSDDAHAALAREAAARLWSKQLKYVVLIGIGGSNLGAQAVLAGLRRACVIPETEQPTILFADTVDQRGVEEVADLIEAQVHHADEALFILVSKSGTTTESIVNAEILIAPFAKRFVSQWKSRVVCISDAGSLLSKRADTLGLSALPIPKPVGGRYSVFSSVGIFPLALAGVDVDAFRKGGAEMARRCTLEAPEENPAMRGAIVLAEALRRGCTVHNLFLFDPSLEMLGKWYRQLLAESIGKERDRQGNVMHIGITPIISIGSTDLHSMAQLYFGGPQDKFTTLVTTAPTTSRKVPADGIFHGLVSGIEGKSPAEIMRAIAGGTEAAYQSLRLPYAHVDLGKAGAYDIGAFMQWKMLETMYLAELLNVNAFDQPSVEAYKKETRTRLGD
ncbi:MAG TPA: hypothetical protein VLB83_02295 [Candidatus Paceibacterota bacterium]|nr:hypothetical protein [Candidatus Paceibacterota bacterium]